MGHFESKVESAATENKFIEELYEKLKNTGDRIDPKKFAGIGGITSEKIDKDLKLVERLNSEREARKNPEEDRAKKLSEISEEVISHEGKWLGENASVIRSSKFDDDTNGVDLIAEFDQKEKGKAAAALDITFSKDMGRKITSISEGIRKGALGAIDYYESPTDNTKVGKKEKIPRFVIALNPKTIAGISESWINKKDKELESHQAQFQILKEIEIQCEFYKTYAEKTGKKDLVDTFQKISEEIKKNYKEKTEGKNPLKDQKKRDSAFYELIKELARQFPEIVQDLLKNKKI